MSRPLLALIDPGSGNLRSAAQALCAAGERAGAPHEIVVTRDPDIVRRAERLVLPGQGAFAAVMSGLAAEPGLIDAMEETARRRARPFFGICVGLQVMAETGREHGEHAGLGWLPGEVVPLAPADPRLKVPHMGWNDLRTLRSHPVGDAAGPGAHAYFVHSFRVAPRDPADLVATAEYGGAVPAILARDTLVGTQFHVEKSQEVGLRLLSAFLTWRP